jgi:hypothetical protein
MVAIYYTVQQLHPDVARLTIHVVLDSISVPYGARALIQLSGPGALTVLRCSPDCLSGGQPEIAEPPFRTWAGAFAATAYFVIKAHSYAVAANGATAAAAFPQIEFSGTQQAIMVLRFWNIPAPKTYDWSSYPAGLVTNSVIQWAEPVTPANPPFGSWTTNGRVASGINHTAQAHDSNFTLIVGILFGIAGGALVAAAQEALHD